MLVHPQFDPVALQIGPVAIRWYGLMYLVGFVLFVVYWLVAGPVGFAILKQKKQTAHSWVVYFLSAVVFTAIAWAGATSLRPKKIEVSHITLFDHVYGQPTQRARVFASVLLPGYGDATVRVGQGDLAVNVPDDDEDEIGELTRAFNRMVSDLRESRERIDYLQRISAWQDFARRLAHEIKNPLTPIQLAAQEVAQAYRGEDPRFAAMLNDARAIIEEEVATLRRLVGEFSSFARLPTADLAEADLAELLRDLERGLNAIAQDVYGEVYGEGKGEPPIALRLELPSTPMVGHVDAMMLKRCIDNLVRNAMEAIAGEARTGRGNITITLRPEGDGMELAVCDDGPGIPARDRERIFDPYVTTKSTGTGLGLAIVKKVILEHQGRIVCRAGTGPDGRGTCFVITLPRERENAL